MIPLFHYLLGAALVSLGASGWEELEFDSVPANRTSFGSSGISISVNQSASPLVHIFSSPKSIRRIEVKGTVTEKADWSTETDDALLRVGVIQAGEKRLNALQKMSAPDWLQRVDELVDGVGSILCFNLTPNESMVGRTRTNPNASIFEEKIQATPDSDGNFEIIAEFSQPISSPGIWLLADGDDSGSSFEVQIESISLSE